MIKNTSKSPCFFASFFTGVFVWLIFALSNFATAYAKHKTPYYDIRPVITDHQVENLLKDHDSKTSEESSVEPTKPFIFQNTRTLTRNLNEADTSLDSPFNAPLVSPKIPPNQIAPELSLAPDSTSNKAIKGLPEQQTTKDLIEEDPLATASTPKKTGSRLPIEQEQLDIKRQLPAVLEQDPGTIIVDDAFETMAPVLASMNNLAYAIGKRGTLDGKYDERIQQLKDNFQQLGWDIYEFSGKTGKANAVDDTPGFIGHNKATNEITLIFRGSQTREDD